MDNDDIWRMVRDEREEILSFLRSLSPEQWNVPSLCEGWRVRDVAVHLLVDEPPREIGWPRAVAKLAGLGLSVHRLNDWWVLPACRARRSGHGRQDRQPADRRASSRSRSCSMTRRVVVPIRP
jgi:uncharacterized protein (TIGR03083 family)